MKLLVLILFGVLTAMIDSSEGLSCYQCISAPGHADKWNQGGCSDSTKDPPSDSLKPCDGTHSPIGTEGKEILKAKGGSDFQTLLAGIETGGVPTCVLAKGTHKGIEYIARDCAMVAKGWHQCKKMDKFKVDKDEVTNALVCACNSDKCNGNEGSAGGGGGDPGPGGDKPSTVAPGGGDPNKDDPDGGVGSISLNCALILMTLMAVIFNF